MVGTFPLQVSSGIPDMLLLFFSLLTAFELSFVAAVLTLVQTKQIRIYTNETVQRTQYKGILQFSSVLLEMWKKIVSFRPLTTYF